VVTTEEEIANAIKLFSSAQRRQDLKIDGCGLSSGPDRVGPDLRAGRYYEAPPGRQ
jgi:hypothetical protein